ncbi:MAG: hypothetical protein WBZ54_05980, partial [Methylocella sp.]
MSKTVELSEPLGSIKTIVLREPRYSDLVDLQLPLTRVELANGASFLQETPSVLGQWIERLSDIDPTLLPQLCLRDVLAIRAAILGFFFAAVAPAPPADARNPIS